MQERKHTAFAMQALDLAEAFRYMLGPHTLQSEGVTYVPELSAPDGPSTGGGVQSLQHLKLVARDGGAATLVVGNASQVERMARLRPFALFARQYRARFRSDCPLDPGDYQRLLDASRSFFEAQGLRVELESAQDEPGEQAGDEDAPMLAAGRSRAAVIAAGIIAVLALGAVAFFLAG
jgi:hypothetical protein